MKFNYTISVSTNTEETWEKMQDTMAMVHCIPGVEEATELSEGNYDVMVVTKLGPITLRFKGNAEVTIDSEQQTMEAGVSMSDSRSGNIYGKFGMKLVPGGDSGGTTLVIEADVVIAGKLGELAQPLIKRKADQIVREFSQNLTDWLQAA